MSRPSFKPSLAVAIVAGLGAAASARNVALGQTPFERALEAPDWTGRRSAPEPRRPSGVAAAKRQARKRKRCRR